MGFFLLQHFPYTLLVKLMKGSNHKGRETVDSRRQIKYSSSPVVFLVT